MRNAKPIQFGNRVRYAFGPEVGDVVSRQTDHGESSFADRSEVFRRSAGCWHVAAHFDAAPAVRNLKMAYGKILRLYCRRDAREPVAGVRFVKNQIASQDDVQG